MSKEQAKEAIIQISNIVDQWTDMNLDANDALELLLPLLKIVISYFDLEQIPAPAGEKKSLYEDLEAGLEEEKLEDLETPGAGSDEAKDKEKEELQEDLFSKEETADLEDDESKSKSKKSKEFAGSNGEIPF